MTYFNKKEEVYHIELTPHGRYLLSIGKLNLKSYAFFDDDIIYDGVRNGVLSEAYGQNDIKTRIQEETPYMKPNGNYYSVESNYQFLESDQSEDVYIKRDMERIETKLESFYHLKNSIGSHEYRDENTTNFKVDFLNNNIQSFNETLSPSDTLSDWQQHIPQINFEIEYTTIRNNVSNDQSSAGLNNINLSTIFSDGSFVDVNEEDAIIQIQELNSEFLKENFRLEVYEESVVTDSSSPIYGHHSYRPLKFRNKVDKVKGDLLLSDKEIEEQQHEIDLQETDPTFVEYYFDINVDKEIASEEICAIMGQIQERNFHLSDDFKCDEYGGVDLDIYASDIGPDDLEDC